MKRGVLLFTLGAAVASAVVAPALVGAVGPSGAKASHNVVGDGVDANADDPFLESFPYVAAPNQGYDHTGHE